MFKKLLRILRLRPRKGPLKKPAAHNLQRTPDVAELERRVLEAMAKGDTIPQSVLSRILGKDD